MATGATQEVKAPNDWQNVEPNDWQNVNAKTAPSAPLPKSADTIQAQPNTLTNWFQNAERDLLKGGQRTAVGKTLGFLQGQPEKGYEGLQSGTSPAAAEFMGSVPLGLTEIGKGTAETVEGHPFRGLADQAGGLLKASTLPGLVAGGPMAESAIEAIPSRVHAGQVLQDIRGAAANVPVATEKTLPELERWNELTQRGGQGRKVIRQLGTRLQNLVEPGAEPLNFPEARDFYTNVSELSHQPMLQTLMGRGLRPTALRQVGKIRSALNEDLGTAASTIGRGEDYANAIKEYAQASKLRKAIIGAGAATGGEVLRRSGLLGKLVSGASQTVK